MPPIRRQTKLTDSRFKKKGFNAGRKRKGKSVRNYNRTVQNYQRKTANMLRIKTLIPRELRIGIQYKTTIVFNDMGHGGNGCIANLIKINLSDPIQGNAPENGTSALAIVDVVSLGGNYVDPSFVRTNSTQLNLKDELDPYFDQYKRCIVTSSNSNVRIVSRPNQFKLGQTFYNGSAAGAQGDSYPYAQNHMPFLAVKGPELDGEMYVSSIKQRNTLGLHPLSNNGETPSFHELQTATPGLKMRRLIATPDSSTKGVMNTAKYTPRYTGIKDWRDNIGELGIRQSNATKTMSKPAFHYVAVHNRQPATATFKPANVVAEIVVNYNVRFFDRANDFEGGDDPIPQPVHGEEL